jgi:hypothetical protein
MLRSTFIVAMVVGAAGCVPISSSGSDAAPACTDIACGPSYQIQFARAAWKPGAYRVDVSADGVAGFCDINIPMSCDSGPRCTGADSWLPTVTGCALNPGQQTIDGIIFTGSTPSSVSVQVSQAGQPLGTQTFAPGYKTSTSGTAACPLTCTQAPTDQLSLAQ